MDNRVKGIIIFFLLIIVGVLCFYLVKNKDRNYVETPIETEKIKKEYKDKDYIFNTAYSTDTIIFPYINLSYPSVNGINFQIKNLYENNTNNISESNYQYYINDHVLSLVIKVRMDEKDNYYTYNINMESGKELTYEEVYYKYSQADLALKNKIGDYIDGNEKIKEQLDDVVLTKEYVVDNSYNDYKVDALANNVKFYLDNKNNLNVIIKIDLKEVYYEYAVFEL